MCLWGVLSFMNYRLGEINCWFVDMLFYYFLFN